MSGLSMGAIAVKKVSNEKTTFKLDIGAKETGTDLELIDLPDGGLVSIEELIIPEDDAMVGLESLASEAGVVGKHKHGNTSMLLPIERSPISGISQGDHTELTVLLHGNCTGDIEILVHWLLHAPEGNSATIHITSPTTKFFDMLALASIIKESKASVSVVVGSISMLSELVLVSVCDHSVCAVDQLISPKFMFDMGVGAKVAKSIEGQTAHVTGLCTHLNTCDILSDGDIEDLLVNGSPITVSCDTLTK